MRTLVARWVDKAKSRGVAYNALDAMKLFAIVNMTADHIGAYLFPEEDLWRAIGRITFPVWFFLVGYSRGREMPWFVWMYAVLLCVIHPFLGYTVFPVNALLTIILCKLIVNICDDYALLPRRIPELLVACSLFSMFTLPLFEYGSVAFLFAIFGRMVRTGEKQHFWLLVVCSYALFMFWQLLGSTYTMLESIYIIIGTAWVMRWLAHCSHEVLWPDWSVSRFKTFVAILSRNTLPYYFWHRLALQLAAAYLLRDGIAFSLVWIDLKF